MLINSDCTKFCFLCVRLLVQDQAADGITRAKKSRRQRRRERAAQAKDKQVHAQSQSSSLDTCSSDIKLSPSGTKSHSDQATQRYVPVTNFVTDSTDLGSLFSFHFPSYKPSTIAADSACHKCSSTNVAALPVECSNDLDHNARRGICVTSDQHARNEAAQTPGLLLTGLHTCGDLAANVLRMFSSNSDVKVTCVVGCCYHLMSERFLSSMPAWQGTWCSLKNRALVVSS